MEKKDVFRIEELNIKDKKGNLKSEASSKISSTKYFPIFDIAGKEKIFKPLSKTKPLSTPLFSYSEVYWSYLINKYIDENTPVYGLAYCKGLSNEQPKYYEKGCLVDNILAEGEELISIYELFEKYKDPLVDISDYTNYCEVQYDYTAILNSEFFTKNKELRKELIKQILCSILRRDANYHYENISLIIKDNIISRVAPIIDLEFSEMFMYPDLEERHKARFSHYDEGMAPLFYYNDDLSYEENSSIFLTKLIEGTVYDQTDSYHFSNLLKNLSTIVILEPLVVKDFLNKIEAMKEEVKRFDIQFNTNFLGKFSSKDWEATRMLYKEGKLPTDEEYLIKKAEAIESKITLDEKSFNKGLKKEVLWNIEKLEQVLKLLMAVKNEEIPNLKIYKNETLYGPVNRIPEEILEILIKEIAMSNHGNFVKKK